MLSTSREVYPGHTVVCFRLLRATRTGLRQTHVACLLYPPPPWHPAMQGTLLYMPPEALKGAPPSEATDIYALGPCL